MTILSWLKKFNSESKEIEQTHGYLNRAAKNLKELQRRQYVLQKFTAKKNNKRLKQRYLKLMWLFRARLHEPGWPGCRDLGTSVKRNKNRLCGYMTTGPVVSRDPGIAMPGSRLTGLKIFRVIAFTGPPRLTGTAKKFASKQTWAAHLQVVFFLFK